MVMKTARTVFCRNLAIPYPKMTMSKQIGIRYTGLPSLPELLYFDEITLVQDPRQKIDQATEQDAANLLKELGITTPPKINHLAPSSDQITRLDLLSDHGVIVDVAKYLTDADANREFQSARELQVISTIRFLKALQQDDQGAAEKTVATETTKEQLITDIQHKINHLLLLAHRRAIESHQGLQPTSIISATEPRADEHLPVVVKLVLNAMPTPVADTPLDKILEFRADSSAMFSLRRLRRWMNEIGVKSQSPNESADELQELIDKYTEYMNFYKMKHEIKPLYSIATTTLDVLENLMKLRLKPAFDALFSFHTQHFALTEAELKAPGREVAYIVRAQDAFTGGEPLTKR